MIKKDILFINSVDFCSENMRPPLGLYSLANVLKNETDFLVEVISFDFLNKIGKINFVDNIDENIKLMIKYIDDRKPSIVSFYTMCNSYAVTLLIAEGVKKCNPNIKICFGGPQATLCVEESLNNFDFIDLIGMGEGELYISKLMNCLVNNLDYSDVPGIAYKKDDKIVYNKMPDMIDCKDLSKYAVLDYDKEIIDNMGRYFPIEAGRGCPFGCTFCSTSMFWGRKFRVKSVKDLINEMLTLNKKYGIRCFNLEHDMFTANKKHLKQFCNELINNNYGFEWTCSSRIDVLDLESIELMKKSNCTGIYMGIETGSKKYQRIVNKKLNLDSALDRIIQLKNAGFDIIVSFIYGFPEESVDDLRDTIDMIQKLFINGISNVQLHLFIPLPHTKETMKISDRVYFDKTQIEQSVFEPKKFNSKMEEMVLKYPDVFIQYYTFDSDIRDKFKCLDFLVFIIGGVYNSFKCTIIQILKKYSLIDLYKDNRIEIEKYYDCYTNEIDISGDTNSESKYNNLFDIAINILNKIIENKDEKIIRCIFDFETKVYEYKKEKKKDACIFRCEIDIIKAIKKAIVEEKEVYVAITTDNKDNINLNYVELDEDIKHNLL